MPRQKRRLYPRKINLEEIRRGTRGQKKNRALRNKIKKKYTKKQASEENEDKQKNLQESIHQARTEDPEKPKNRALTADRPRPDRRPNPARAAGTPPLETTAERTDLTTVLW